MGVHTRYINGLGKSVTVAPETLVRVCAALGAPIARPEDAADALRAHRETAGAGLVPPVLVAWDGFLAPLAISADGPAQLQVHLEDGPVVSLLRAGAQFRVPLA